MLICILLCDAFLSEYTCSPFHAQTNAHPHTYIYTKFVVALQICQPSFLIFFTFSSSNNASGVQCCDQAGLLHATTSQDKLSSQVCRRAGKLMENWALPCLSSELLLQHFVEMQQSIVDVAYWIANRRQIHATATACNMSTLKGGTYCNTLAMRLQ